MLQALNSGSEITLKESISQRLAEDYRTIPRSKNGDMEVFFTVQHPYDRHTVIQLFWWGNPSHFLPLVRTSTTINIQGNGKLTKNTCF